ncbi:DUF1592 domain-containing protein [Akkermansiaceae bacterium]|nr:DUF1592 domain-containing protein [Akkermansiaceae bacterium]MDA8980742.1 DUF1592 domain-containing protein [bacterium]MDA7535413.1 DUF1592 domain-containing protein [Akkermansiaceae bacterium]MDA8968627.1 DUF1592 domain-containing protein [Akkermansiaceae bacterium]MDB4143461.1 DUF1592 domain-containing protein [Akkermansiaceae bacterium]
MNHVLRLSYQWILLLSSLAQAQMASQPTTLEKAKTTGALNSSYLKPATETIEGGAPEANLKGFHGEIKAILAESCVECHGPDKQKAKFRVDILNPDLINGEDADWWLEIMDVLSNGEMPPEDAPEMADKDREKTIAWLSSEIQLASQVRRSEQGHSSFRRMTRYEYHYALQDLLGLPLNFSEGLPPDPVSEDGFSNSSEMLHMSANQYSTYLELNRKALQRVTVRGERPEVLYWGLSADKITKRKVKNPDPKSAKRPAPTEERIKAGAHYRNLTTGAVTPAKWHFRRAAYAWEPTTTLPEVSEEPEVIAVLPAGERIIFDLGNRLPDAGLLRVRVRASRSSPDPDLVPSLALDFGWQGNNNSKANVRISEEDLVIDALPGQAQFYEWDIPISDIYPRNPVRKLVELGTPKMTNPAEYIQLQNTALSSSADLHFDYVEISSPVYEQWPPASHTRIFIESEHRDDENVYAREVIANFMKRAWRRGVSEGEIERKVAYFTRIRPSCSDFQEAIIEVLATVLSSPRFLYLVQSEATEDRALDDFELATRLSMFLWSSTPDEELLAVAAAGKLSGKDELLRQTRRLLEDSRHERFSQHFVRQWLGLSLLDHLVIAREDYPSFDGALKDALQKEPIAFFGEMLQHNQSVIDFLHADYALVNQRLADHYGLPPVVGNHFRRVPLKLEDRRGGLVTQAGLLAMNSDGKDSHPLKRGVWLLERILNDPPPPAPPAVPEIDLADPEIAKLTLKERIENHRDDPACMSCHAKIDPWGIAFENFDAIGSWRDEIKGVPVDASSRLFNDQELHGVEGLKRFLLEHRQDQFVRAMVHKLTTYGLGRPMAFRDRASIDEIAGQLRKEGDGLKDLIEIIVTSDLFREH